MSRHLIGAEFLNECRGPTEKMVMALVTYEAWGNGHGDVGHCGTAEFGLAEFSEATGLPPGKGLRLLKRLAKRTGSLCVEHDDLILFAVPEAHQSDFDQLYTSRGFEGLPPRLPHPSRYVR